jgi:hypothetical protein
VPLVHFVKEHFMTPRPIILASTTLALLFISACAESTTPAVGRAVTVSFASLSTAAGASFSSATESGAQRSISASGGTDVLVIDKVQIVLSRLELVRAGASCTATAAAGDDVVDEHECTELSLEPMLVDLPINSTVANVISINVPAGSYSALEAKVRALRADGDQGRASKAFLTAHPDLAGLSVVVIGTFNGTPFTWRGAPRAEFEASFSPALVVDAAPVNLTVHADVTTWFKTQSGTLIDPATANAGGSNAGVVAENVRRSFRAFRDDDRNGHDDGDDTRRP